jgi:hypothetical protein
MKITQIKDIELDKYKNLARQLSNEVEYLLDEIEQLKAEIIKLQKIHKDETKL